MKVFSFSFFFLFLLFKPSHQTTNDSLTYTNPRLLKAFKALEAWKHHITSDPNQITSSWYGLHVCNYNGVYCAPAPDDNYTTTVAGIDLNFANLEGTLPEELGLLKDLAFFHINSNRFSGTIPQSFSCFGLLYELDVSNNQLSGPFPSVVLSIPKLQYLDIRFNKFFGEIPSQVFDLKLDALFINNNNFQSVLPQNIGNSPVSVLVFADNNLNSCFPSSLVNLKDTLEELIITNSGLKGCLPSEIGLLNKLTVFDVSQNQLVGSLPASIASMTSLEQLNVANNKLSGVIPENICRLPKLENFTFSNNFFCGEPEICLKLMDKDDRNNCLLHRPLQRSLVECSLFYAHNHVDCGAFGCSRPTTPPQPPPSKSLPLSHPPEPRHP
ncbi:hypothetical protein UlMin_009717 [Ulmus minor]